MFGSNLSSSNRRPGGDSKSFGRFQLGTLEDANHHRRAPHRAALFSESETQGVIEGEIVYVAHPTGLNFSLELDVAIPAFTFRAVKRIGSVVHY
jgi:hypothetical protein